MNQHASDSLFTLFGAIAVAVWPGADALLRLPLLGIPIAALVAAMLGSGFSYLQRRGATVDTAPARMLGIASDAFLGGWLAVGLANIPHLEAYGLKAIPIEAIAGLSAFLMQAIRQRAGDYFERLFQAALNMWASLFGRGKSRGEEAP